MKWFGKHQAPTERRESSYTDAVVQSILQSAGGAGSFAGSFAAPAATGALEACSSIVARCFAAADVQGPEHLTRALTPAVLSMIGRALIRSGEILYAIDTEGGRFSLLPCSSFDVSGGAFPESWRYRLSLSGPSRIVTLDPVPAAGVVHVMLQGDPERPWRGVGPLQSARLAGRLSAEVSAALGDEVSGPRGHLLPVPIEGGDGSLDELKAGIRTLAGSIATVESQGSTGWADGGATRPHKDWQPVRLGADPPTALVALAETASMSVFAACGIPYSLAVDSTSTGARESYRRLLHSTIVPMARIVESELSDKLGASIRLNFDSLFAGDLSGRARAFQSLVGGGMDVSKAAGLAGLMDPTD